MNLSAIVPTLDSGATLEACLEALGGIAEIVVADGGSSDDTIAIAEAAGARLVRTGRGRGIQLAAGAAAAGGDWLLFVHADTILAPDWRVAAASHAANFPGDAACFRFRLDDPAWQARLIEGGVKLRTRLGLPYGDQGLLVPRFLYERAGGYRPLPLMEDVDLVRRLRPVRLLDADALTSAERWRRDGWLARSARNLACLGLYGAGVPPQLVARIYG